MSEYMNDDDRVQVLRKWWEDNGTFLVVALVLVIGGVIGWRWYVDYTQTRDEAASATYQRYLEARQRDAKAEETAALLATLDKDFRTTGYRIFTLFYRAHDAVDSQRLCEGDRISRYRSPGREGRSIARHRAAAARATAGSGRQGGRRARNAAQGVG